MIDLPIQYLNEKNIYPSRKMLLLLLSCVVLKRTPRESNETFGNIMGSSLFLSSVWSILDLLIWKGQQTLLSNTGSNDDFYLWLGKKQKTKDENTSFNKCKCYKDTGRFCSNKKIRWKFWTFWSLPIRTVANITWNSIWPYTVHEI